MSKFTETQLEKAFIDLLAKEGVAHTHGESIVRNPEEVLLKDDVRKYLTKRYARHALTDSEIDQIILTLDHTE